MAGVACSGGFPQEQLEAGYRQSLSPSLGMCAGGGGGWALWGFTLLGYVCCWWWWVGSWGGGAPQRKREACCRDFPQMCVQGRGIGGTRGRPTWKARGKLGSINKTAPLLPCLGPCPLHHNTNPHLDRPLPLATSANRPRYSRYKTTLKVKRMRHLKRTLQSTPATRQQWQQH